MAISLIAGVAIGYVAGVFTPAIGRKIKALFVRESKIAVEAAKSDATAAVTSVEKKL